ncbi:MAG TPA: twin-arginine translocase TatA/TatE family subunit [Alphaproteobacteria bacterium]|nr:twin-arginine translocase TatA/TatE family subunit [Alphaproteobacteria bacterium]
MGSFSIWHWLIVLAVVLILFGGGGKISRIMGDMAKGVKAFKKGLHEEDEHANMEAPKSIPAGNPTGGVQPGAAAQSAEVRRDDAARG